MARKGGLGKGLDALIPSEIPSSEGGALLVPITAIHPNPRQPRQQMAEESLQELADSIREHGILQPLIVTQEGNQRYVLIAGERRLRAAELAGLEMVPVLVRQATDEQRLELALIENVQRANLSPLETAEAYRQLTDEFGLSQEAVSQQVGKSRVSVSNTLRLLKLPEPIRQALADEQITEGHARALLTLNSPSAQLAVMQIIIQKNLNVRQAEELARKWSESAPKRTQPAPRPEVTELEGRLRSRFGTKVTLHHGKKGGTLTIHYYSEEELNALINQFLGD